MMEKRYLIFETVRDHFQDAPLDEIEITKRTYGFRAGPDLQVAFNNLQENGFEIAHFYATQRTNHDENPAQKFADVYIKDRRNPVMPVSPSYEEFDIGEEDLLRCLKNGLWLLRVGPTPLFLLLYTGDYQGIRIEVAAPTGEAGSQATAKLFAYLNRMIEESRCYRGKTLSLAHKEMYSGTHALILVHKIKPVEREQVILPPTTIDLLDRNVLRFIKQRKRLGELGMSTKKGLLFYGPPGTGKTLTVHYLARALEGNTVFLITGEQICNLDEYMTLARMLQPSIIVMEDVDLIARERDAMRDPGEEMMLNKLLNEMDGTKLDAEIIFVLTTNRAAVLEKALTARPGRIDQAIEFPLPDAAGRTQLVDLYSHGLQVPTELRQHIVDRTDHVSASFIRELMRRSIQFALERDDLTEALTQEDVDAALDELLNTGGSLNRALLGASAREKIASVFGSHSNPSS